MLMKLLRCITLQSYRYQYEWHKITIAYNRQYFIDNGMKLTITREKEIYKNQKKRKEKKTRIEATHYQMNTTLNDRYVYIYFLKKCPIDRPINCN